MNRNKNLRAYGIKLLCFLLLFCMICVLFIFPHIQEDGEPALAQATLPVLVIDAGHGGIDGGASSDSGVLEKDINLEISKKLCRLAESIGIRCVMTRCEDEMLTLPNDSRSKKLADLKRRVQIAEECGDCVFVSIHQNKFPQKSCSGLTVYYSKNDAFSQTLAQSIQKYVKQRLQPDNNRPIKQADSAIYVLDNISSPAVLIECGFLSNDEECRLLCTDIYQKKLVCAVFGAIFNSLQDNANTNENKNDI